MSLSAFNTKHNVYAVVCGDGTAYNSIKLYNTQTASLLHHYTQNKISHQSNYTSIDLYYKVNKKQINEGCIAVSTDNGFIHIYNISTGDIDARINNFNRSCINSIQFTTNGMYLHMYINVI